MYKGFSRTLFWICVLTHHDLHTPHPFPPFPNIPERDNASLRADTLASKHELFLIHSPSLSASCRVLFSHSSLRPSFFETGVRERHIVPRNVTNVTRHIFCHRKKWPVWRHSPTSETGSWEEIRVRPILTVLILCERGLGKFGILMHCYVSKQHTLKLETGLVWVCFRLERLSLRVVAAESTALRRSRARHPRKKERERTRTKSATECTGSAAAIKDSKRDNASGVAPAK